jgi:hypothetical protein
VIGRLEGAGRIEVPMECKQSISLYSAEQHVASRKFGWLTLVSLWPKTGRTHQLRKHMAYLGHPILGDLQYKHHRKAVQKVLRSCGPGSAVEAAGEPAGSIPFAQQAGGVGEGSNDEVVWVLEEGAASRSGGASSSDAGSIAGSDDGSEGSDDAVEGMQHHSQSGAASNSSSSSSRSSKLVPLDADVLAAEPAAEGTSGASEAGGDTPPPSRRVAKVECLSNGSAVQHICLWAVELHLNHPITQEPMRLSLPLPAHLADVIEAERGVLSGEQ